MEHYFTKSAKIPDIISPDTGLSSLQERCAMILAAGASITDAAKELGISRGAIYRWQSQLPFQCFYNLMKQDVKEFVEGRVLALNASALQAVKASLASDNEAVRLKAAVWVLDKVCQYQVKGVNIREELKTRAKIDSNGWDWEANYKRKLEGAGLED